MRTTDAVLDGLAFGEGPRWRGDALWFSDMHNDVVKRYTPSTGAVDDVVRAPGQPSGLGWDDQGRLLVVSMADRRLLRWGGENVNDLMMVADLAAYTDQPLNDMVLRTGGLAYIGGFGYDSHGGGAPRPTVLLAVDPSTGSHRVAAPDLQFPNGMVITSDGSTLIARRVVRRTNRLRSRSMTAAGCAIDAWAPPRWRFPRWHLPRRRWVRVGHVARRSPGAAPREGGEVVDRVNRPAIDWRSRGTLGGDDGCTLFVCTSKGLGLGKAAGVLAHRPHRSRSKLVFRGPAHPDICSSGARPRRCAACRFPRRWRFPRTLSLVVGGVELGAGSLPPHG